MGLGFAGDEMVNKHFMVFQVFFFFVLRYRLLFKSDRVVHHEFQNKPKS